MLLKRALILTTEPAGTLRSLDELFALAYAMEQEAANRYGELADDMRRQKRSDLAEVFSRLAAAEREHVESVSNWSQSRRAKIPDPTLVKWQMPDTFDPETAAEMQSSRLMTPYRALALAVRNEERAFAFWSYVAAYSEDPEIKTAAETMAREELGHVSILRKERRAAYRLARETASGAGGAVAPQPRVDAPTLELRLAAHLAMLERRLAGPAAGRARDLLAETTRMAELARGVGSFPATLEQADAQTIAEALADAYLAAAENSQDPARIAILQDLAQEAISRLAWLRSLT